MERVPTRLALLHELTSGLAERMGLQSIAGFVLGVGLNAIGQIAARCVLSPLTGSRSRSSATSATTRR